MTFPGILIFWTPKIPTATPFGGGGVKFFFIDFLDSSWNLPDFWNFDPQPTPPPPEPPRGGMGKKKIIDFLGSSWHFPDFWFFDSLKFPLRPPVVVGGGGGNFFLSIFSTVHEIYRTIEMLTPPPRTPPPGWDG